MQVFDEITKQFTDSYDVTRIVLACNPQIIFGYTSRKETLVYLYVPSVSKSFETDLSLFQGNIIYDNYHGCYTYAEGLDLQTITKLTTLKGRHAFPYLLDRHYEACCSFDLFKDRQTILNLKEYKASKYLKRTYGIEFETNCGFIPENICYRDGLIPLRDGSISGVEYSTIILQGNEGLSLLEQQLNTLKTYTDVDKDCSMHVHIGGFPLDLNLIYRVNQICYCLQQDLCTLLPPYTFNTSQYKSNHKDYCKLVRKYSTPQKMYEGLVGRKFFGSLTQAHPNDILRERKWQINTRYYWCNLINILCYNINKTIEFRFLRPTRCFKKILLWLYIFDAILSYAESDYIISDIKLTDIITSIYPHNLAVEIIKGIYTIKNQTLMQGYQEDLIGLYTENEEQLFNVLDI